MPDFTINADSIDVDQIMRQIRARIREKRGVDYTEEQIRELAAAKLERFLDPTGIRSDLLEQFRKRPTLPPLYRFESTTLFDSDKAIVRFFRWLLRPFLKLMFNPNVLTTTLHTQASLNDYFQAHQPLQFELLHNLVLELTRAGIEVKNLKMRLESVQSRLEFNERRARALEAVVQYKPDSTRGRGEDRGERRQGRSEPPRSQPFQPRAPHPPPPATRADTAEESATPTTEPQGGIDPITGGESLRTRRRRRRRGRRSTWDPASAGLSAGSAALSDGTNEAPEAARADGQAAQDAGVKPDPTHEAQSDTAAEVRLKPDATYEPQEVRLKPDSTYGGRTDDGVDMPHDSADGESRGRDDEPR
jgi:hypothetical protein